MGQGRNTWEGVGQEIWEELALSRVRSWGVQMSVFSDACESEGAITVLGGNYCAGCRADRDSRLSELKINGDIECTSIH
jgi:hypothetical protein